MIMIWCIIILLSIIVIIIIIIVITTIPTLQAPAADAAARLDHHPALQHAGLHGQPREGLVPGRAPPLDLHLPDALRGPDPVQFPGGPVPARRHGPDGRRLVPVGRLAEREEFPGRPRREARRQPEHEG